MCFGFVICLTKLALFLLYLRIFSPDRWTRYLIHFGIWINVAFYVSCSIAQAIMCAPKHGQTWQESTFTPLCRDTQIFSWLQGPWGVVSDLYLLILPMPAIWRLQMPLRKKIGVCAIFATGFL